MTRTNEEVVWAGSGTYADATHFFYSGCTCGWETVGFDEKSVHESLASHKLECGKK